MRLTEFGTKSFVGNSHDLGQRNILTEKAWFFSAFHYALLFTSACGNCQVQPFWFSHLDVNSCVLKSTLVKKKLNVQIHFRIIMKTENLCTFSTLTRSLFWMLFFFLFSSSHFLFFFSSGLQAPQIQPPGWESAFSFSSREDDELENLKYLFTEGPKSTRVTTQSVSIRIQPQGSR